MPEDPEEQTAADIFDGLGPWAGETTEDGKVSLVTARCLGACGLAPAVVFDGEVAGKIGTETTLERVAPWTDGSLRPEEAQP